MKIKFPKQDTKKIISAIENAMAGRSLGDLVSLADSGQGITVKISKLGTSTLGFQREDNGSETILSLTEEKIAFAHKAFKDDVTDKLVQVIEKAGGKVSR